MGAKTELIHYIRSLDEEDARAILKELRSRKAPADNVAAAVIAGEMRQVFGLWEGRDVSLVTIRAEAWRRQ